FIKQSTSEPPPFMVEESFSAAPLPFVVRLLRQCSRHDVDLMLVGEQSAVLQVPDVVPVRTFRIRPANPILIRTRDRIVDDAAVVPPVQWKALCDVRVILRSGTDTGLEIELQSLRDIDDRLEIR